MPVSYTIQGLPKWASFDSATGALTGTPSGSDLGLSGDITITASDGSNTGTVGPFDIRVLPAGTVPQRGTAPAIGGIPLTSAPAGQPYVFQPTARDITGAPLTFAIANCPPWATFSTATGTLSGTPSAAQAGAYSNIEILVSDGTWTIALPAFSIAVSAGGSGTAARQRHTAAEFRRSRRTTLGPTRRPEHCGDAFDLRGRRQRLSIHADRRRFERGGAHLQHRERSRLGDLQPGHRRVVRHAHRSRREYLLRTSSSA